MVYRDEASCSGQITEQLRVETTARSFLYREVPILDRKQMNKLLLRWIEPNWSGGPKAVFQQFTGQTGFTLIELMVTIAIAAILAVIAIPSFTYITTTNRLSSAANDVIYALNSGRMAAIKGNPNVVVCADNTCTVTTTSNPPNPVTTVLRGPISGISGTIQIQNVTQLSYSGQGLAITAVNNPPYTGLVVDIFTTAIASNNRRCLYMVAGSILQTCTVTLAGACPNAQPNPCN
jgi:type IV fimbrial biogenesis protein FimT